MKVIAAVLAAAAVLMATPSVAGAARVRCRIEKPAHSPYGSWANAVEISDLTATNLPKHRTLGGSPCATADWLAYGFESSLVEEGETPSVLETDDDELTRALPLTWSVRCTQLGQVGWLQEIDGVPITEEEEEMSYEFLGTPLEALSAVFRHGQERVSLRAEYAKRDGSPIIREGGA